jgi:hypothetical protein
VGLPPRVPKPVNETQFAPLAQYLKLNSPKNHHILCSVKEKSAGLDL